MGWLKELAVLYFAKHNAEELKRQAIEDQAKGIEKMGNVKTIKDGINSYIVNGRPKLADKSNRVFKKETPAHQQGLAVTHGPDCCLGNQGDQITGYGGAPENSSIGSQNKRNQSNILDTMNGVDDDVKIKVKVIIDGKEVYKTKAEVESLKSKI